MQHGDLTAGKVGHGVDEPERAKLGTRVLQTHLRGRIGEYHDDVGPAPDCEGGLADLDPLAVTDLDERLRFRGELADLRLCDRVRGPSGYRSSRRIPENELTVRSDDRDAVACLARQQRREPERLREQQRGQSPMVRGTVVHATSMGWARAAVMTDRSSARASRRVGQLVHTSGVVDTLGRGALGVHRHAW